MRFSGLSWLSIQSIASIGSWENILVFFAWAALAASYRRYSLARVSYCLIAFFLALHAVGAHYTYSLTPIGDLVRDFLGQERNHYDRFVHFAFGLLLVYPCIDFLERYVLAGKRAWCAFFAVCLILAFSGLYEIIEWAAAVILDPEAGIAFLGSQGDVFDGQKDAALAFLGSLIGLAAALLIFARKPPLPMRSAE